MFSFKLEGRLISEYVLRMCLLRCGSNPNQGLRLSVETSHRWTVVCTREMILCIQEVFKAIYDNSGCQ